jgi:RNA polymerase sigma-70 factor (ECF subfamily)
MRNEYAVAGQPKSEFYSPNAQSDESLIKAIAGGDQFAMRTLYARHNVRVYHFIARVVSDAGRAEDLVSEVFIDVWRQADHFEGRSQVSTWILSIARFKTLSALHRHRDTQISEIDLELIEDSTNTPEEVVLNRDRSAQLRICLAQMSRDHREILARPRLLSRKVRRGGRRGHSDSERHGQDSHVLRSQTVGQAIVDAPGFR